MNRDLHEGPIREDAKRGDTATMRFFEAPRFEGLDHLVRRVLMRQGDARGGT